MATAGKPIWARWEARDDGGLDVVATYGEAGRYVSRELRFDSLEEAAEALGPSFADVVTRVIQAGGRAGRWRP